MTETDDSVRVGDGVQREFAIGVAIGLVVGILALGGGLYASGRIISSTTDAYVLGVAITYGLWKTPDVVRWVRTRATN